MHTTPRQTIARHIAKVNPQIETNAKTVEEQKEDLTLAFLIAIAYPYT